MQLLHKNAMRKHRRDLVQREQFFLESFPLVQSDFEEARPKIHGGSVFAG